MSSLTPRATICMLVRNPFTHDARATREAGTLTDAGFRVVVVAVRSDPSLPAREERGGLVVERIAVTGRVFRLLRRAVSPAGRAQRIGLRRSPAPGGPAPAGRSPAGEPSALGQNLRDAVISFGRSMSTILYVIKAARRARAFRPLAYHCHDLDTLPAGILAARRAPAPILYDSHELYAHLNVPHPTRLRRRFVEMVERRALRRVTSVVTVNESIARHLAERYGIERPVVVMNAPPAGGPSGDGEIPDPFRREALKALYLGGVTRGRGIEEAIEALRHLPEAILILMGPEQPPFGEEFRDRAARTGVADRVFFVPPVPHELVTAVAAHATVGLVTIANVCLSYYYSLPNKLFECLHAGLPVVTSDFPELRRIVDTYRVGRTCDPSDPRAIAAAIRDLVADPEAYAHLRERARAAARDFTWEREAEKLLAVYRDVVGLPRER